MSEQLLPPGAYLAWRYVDARRAIDRRQIYYEDGRIDALEGRESWELCRFTYPQVAAAKAAITESGLPTSIDVPATGTHDTALVTYQWRLDGVEGCVSNAGYPALQHNAMDRLDAKLAELEEAAGGWPLLSDE